MRCIQQTALYNFRSLVLFHNASSFILAADPRLSRSSQGFDRTARSLVLFHISHQILRPHSTPQAVSITSILHLRMRLPRELLLRLLHSSARPLILPKCVKLFAVPVEHVPRQNTGAISGRRAALAASPAKSCARMPTNP